MAKDYIKTEIGERVEQSDFDHASSTSQIKTLQSIMTDLVTGDAGTAQGQPLNYVIDGFDCPDGYGSPLPGTTITINGGKAILGLRDSTVQHGLLLSAGASSRNRDINLLNDGTYGVYIRASLPEASFLNRLFWNALAATPVETPRVIGTRRTENWEITVELVSPGPEWMLVATAVKVGSAVTLTDKRRHLFEGQSSNTYVAVDAEWGGGLDRNADRATNGVKSVARTFRGLLRQVQDIIGGSPLQWYKAINGTQGSGPRSLTQLNEEKFDRDGTQVFSGDFLPDVDVTRNIGSSSFKWESIYGRLISLISPTSGNGAQIYIQGRMNNGNGGELARVSIPFSQDSGVNRTNILESFGFTSAAATYCRIYRAVSSLQAVQSNTLEFIFNARYDNDTVTWTRDDAGDSFKVAISKSQLSVLKRLAASSSSWLDSAWDEVLFTIDSTGINTRQVLAIIANGLTARFKSTHALNSGTSSGERILIKEVINTTDGFGYREYVYQNNSEFRLERAFGCYWDGTNWNRDFSGQPTAHVVREGSLQNARFTKYTNLVTPWLDSGWDACDQAYGTIVTTDTPATVASFDGFNIASVSFVGGTLEMEIVFETPMVDSNYSVVVTDTSLNGSIQYKPFALSDTSFSVKGWVIVTPVDFDDDPSHIFFSVKHN